jgi:DNA repair protein RadC
MKDLPAEQRPREKLLTRGAGALADAELLALLLRTGYKGRGVVAMAGDVIAECKGLAGLMNATPERLKNIKGLGPAKRAELIAVMELARRALAQRLTEAPVFNDPGRVKDYLSLQLGSRQQEVFVALFLDAQFRLLHTQEMFYGTLTQTSVYPREVVRQALAHNAGAVVFAHNHPSGVAEPSRADEYLTQTLRSALKLIDVQVLDHIVVGQGHVVSMAERGLM